MTEEDRKNQLLVQEGGEFKTDEPPIETITTFSIVNAQVSEIKITGVEDERNG